MRRSRGTSPTSPFRALAHHHASSHHGHSSHHQQTPESVSSLIRSFNLETNPTRPIRPSPLTASAIPDMPLDLVDRIRSFPLFLSAPDDFLAAIGMHLRPQVHAAHDLILTEGDEAKAMYWLVRGVVAVTSRDGEAVYAELKPGSFFGEIGVLMDVPRTATIVARTKCLLVVLKKEDLQAELPRYPDMEKAIRQEAQERLTILKKKQQERSSQKTAPPAVAAGVVGGSWSAVVQLSEPPPPTARESVPGEVTEGGAVVNAKKRKSPSPGIIEDPAVGGSALGGGYVNVRKTLKELPLFATLPPDILHFLGLSAQPKTYPPFTDIIRQGSPGHDIYFIVSGEAEVVHELASGGGGDGGGDGDDASASISSPTSISSSATPSTPFSRPRLTQGQYFGEVASLGLSRGRTATVRSITSVECLMISGEALDELWRRCPPEVKHQVEETARERYSQQQASGADDVADVAMPDPDSGGLGLPTPVMSPPHRRPSVPNVVFTTPSKPSSPSKASASAAAVVVVDEADMRQPSDPDPFLSVDMENMRNRRRNSLAPPTPPQAESSSSQALPAAQASEANSSPLKLFSFPPMSSAKLPGLPGNGAGGAPSKISKGEAASKVVSDEEAPAPFKKARTRAQSPTPKGEEPALSADKMYPPEEVMLGVFQQLDLVEMIRASAVCRRWRHLLRTSPRLCTHVDLSPFNSLVNDWSLAHVLAPFIGARPVEVDISNCFHITDEGFQVLWQTCGRNVRAWRMKSVWDVSANQILDMSENAPHLEEIDWSNCRKVGDNLLARVVGWVVPQPAGAAEPQPATSQAARGRRAKEKHQQQRQQQQQQQQQPARSGPAPGTVIGCPNLKILDLSYCKHITDRSMLHLAAHASGRLRSLTLTRCTSVTDAGFQAWAPYRFNALTRLCLADCTYLSDSAIVSLVNAAKNLVRLDLSFCCALSDTATEVVALGLPLLQDLRLAFCGSAVSDASLRCVALHLNDLRGLSVRGCVRVTGVGAEHVLDGCARLEWLDVSQCKNLASWVAAGGIARWGYDERQQGQGQGQGQGQERRRRPTSPPPLPPPPPPLRSTSAWTAANRTGGPGAAPGAAPGTPLALPSMRGPRRRMRKPVKFILEKGAFDGLR